MVRLTKAVLVLLCVACAGLGEAPVPDAASADPFGEPIRAVPGQCLLDDVVIDCSEPHSDEVFFAFAAPSPRPAEEALSDLASTACEAAFIDYVGEPAPTSGDYVGWVLPEEGDTVTCLLSGSSTRSGSARGQSQRP